VLAPAGLPEPIRASLAQACEGATADPAYAQRENYWDIGFQQRLVPGLTLGLDGYFRRSTHLLDEGQFGAPIILTPVPTA
jgi:hypothetical protein